MNTPMEHVSLHPKFREACRLGQLELHSVRIGPPAPELRAEIDELCRRRRRFFDVGTITELPGIAETRGLFRGLGTDPSKVRPCSEVFLRRVLRDGEFPAVCNLVDLCNYCSAEIAMPVCVYDREKIEAPVELRPGRAGEELTAITGRNVPVQGRPVLADRRGPFGSPFADSSRTRITDATQVALVVWLTPLEQSALGLEAEIQTFAERLRLHGIGRSAAMDWFPR